VRIDLSFLLHSSQQVLDAVSAARAAALLGDAKMHMVNALPTRELVSQLLPTLRARQANASRTGTRIYGLVDTITALADMDPDAVVIGYGFVSPTAAGNFYLTDGDSNVLLGVTIVDRDEK
jgi:hypothetical protein